MELNQEILQKIRNIEIHTRRLLSGTLLGDYSSARKGSGLEFDQLAEYQFGDDVRFIDWKSSARTNKMLIKQYIEERNRIIMLVIDGSASLRYGSSDLLKQDIAAQIGAVLALVADYSKDYVGLILFSQDVVKVLPPRRGRQHVRSIMQELFSHTSAGKTSLVKALEHLMLLKKNNALVCIISDFIDTGYEDILKVVCRKHDTVAIRCFDRNEELISSVGLLSIIDPETGETAVINTNNKALKIALRQHQLKVSDTLRAAGAELLDIKTTDDFIGQIIRFFQKRMLY